MAIDYKKQGRDNRKHGLLFEAKTRKKLEKDGFVVSKWQNNVDLDKNIIHAARGKYIPGRGAMPGLGFPDYVAFMPRNTVNGRIQGYNTIFVECKTNNKLSKVEKQKMQWLTDKGHSCWIAYENEKGKPIFRKFVEYKERTKVRRSQVRNTIR